MSPPASAAARALNAPAPARRQTRSAPGAPAKRPRRVSGPATARTTPARTAPGRTRPGRAAPARRGVSARTAPLTLARPAQALVRAVSLERLLRTRVWIGVIAFALIGIVTMQLALLKLNTGIGNALERTTALQRENATLSIADSEADSAEAIEAKASSAGMLPLAPGELHFLRAGGAATVRRAVKALRALKVSEGDTGIASSASDAAYTTSTEGETELAESAAAVEGESIEGEAAVVSEDAEAEAEADVEAGSDEVAEGEVASEEEASVTSPYAGEPETGESAETALAAGGGVQAGTGE